MPWIARSIFFKTGPFARVAAARDVGIDRVESNGPQISALVPMDTVPSVLERAQPW